MQARLYGKSNVYNFKIEIFNNIKAFDFLKIIHHESGEVLTQVTNITRDNDKLIGDCKIIGYRENGVLRNIRTPFTNDAKIETANDRFIEKIIGLKTEGDAFMGVLEHHPDLKIKLDLKKAITKHIAILAKSGAGKSYTVGVLLEEIIKKNIPIIILDPHNEYSTIKYPNTNKKDIERLEKFCLNPQGFLNQIKEFSPDISVNPQSEPITLNINDLKPMDLMNSLPQKLSPGQQSLLFNILSNLNDRINFDELIFNISNEEATSKWSLISLLEHLKKLKLFSPNPTQLKDLVKYKRASIISLKGIEPYVQEVFVSHLLKNLFEARKKEEIPPFLLVIEEAHNFCPERSFGEMRTSKIIRTIASEGRKFGIGLCVVSQRAAKIDKNVLSQCTTQIVMKITNPNDLKSVISSSEGVDSDSENEIQKLNIGTCLLTGIIDIPLKVNVRPRISKHGGESVDIVLPYEIEKDPTKPKKENFHTQKEEKPKPKDFYKGKNTEFIQHVSPEVEPQDAKIILDAKEIEVQLIPAYIIKIKNKKGNEINLLFDRANKQIIKTIFPFEGYKINLDAKNLSTNEKKILETILTLPNSFNPAEILIKSNLMYNEILRLCDNLTAKGILKQNDKKFELANLNFIKNLDNLNFYGNQKFEEISYDTKIKPEITESETKEMLNLFGHIENIKEIFILRYVGR